MEIQFRDHATRNVVSLAFGKADPKGERGEILASTRETQPPRIRSFGGDVFPNVFPGEIVFQTVFASIRRDGRGGGGLINGTRN